MKMKKKTYFTTATAQNVSSDLFKRKRKTSFVLFCAQNKIEWQEWRENKTASKKFLEREKK